MRTIVAQFPPNPARTPVDTVTPPRPTPAAAPAAYPASFNADMFALAVKVGYAVCIVFAALYWALGHREGALVIMAAIVPVALSGLAHTRLGRLRLGLELLNATAYVVLAWLSFRGGGLRSPQVAWLMIVPFVGMMVGFQRSSLVWCVIVTATLGGFWYAEHVLGPLPQVLGDYPNVLRVVATAGLFCVILSFLFLVERARRLALEQARGAAAALEERNAELAAARDAALAAAEAKSRFLANMSHEIRTPLNGVLGMTELLIDTPLTNTQRGFAETAYRSGRTLLELLNDILNFSKNETGRLALERIPFQPREIVEEVVKPHAQSASVKGLDLTAHVDVRVPNSLVGDPARLRQILNNLVGNAVKFTLRGGIAIRVFSLDANQFSARDRRTEASAPVRIRFEIQDTGIGIAPELLHRLFQPFSQADESTTRRFGGTGLGLAICRQLAEAMGGTITVDSVPEHGSTFACEIPFEVVAERSTVPADDDSSSDNPNARLRGIRVLVAEDNRVNQLLAAAMLNRLGCVATVVADGLEAVDVCLRGTFDLVLMDCQMPGIDGFEATRRLRNAGLIHLPIVAMTADVMEGDRERCLEGGMDDYLPKPFGQAELATVLARGLATRVTATPRALTRA